VSAKAMPAGVLRMEWRGPRRPSRCCPI